MILFVQLLQIGSMLAPAAVGLQGNTMNGSAVQLLEDARSLNQLSNPKPLRPGQVSPDVMSGQASPTFLAPAVVAPAQGQVVGLFELNGIPIQQCSSGLPCWDQLRYAAGMR